ncbi:insulin-like growth factor 1 receptor [Macrobrachium nipponense]|uniref:insulin-like growth factor 1 receptor n=1 Tax=Macrobrachium nipponense TaxID=159736 RepID=UPI0030C8AB18
MDLLPVQKYSQKSHHPICDLHQLRPQLELKLSSHYFTIFSRGLITTSDEGERQSMASLSSLQEEAEGQDQALVVCALSQPSISPHPSCAFGEPRKSISTLVTPDGREWKWIQVKVDLGETRTTRSRVKSEPVCPSCLVSFDMLDLSKHSPKGPNLLLDRNLSDFRISNCSYLVVTDDCRTYMPIMCKAKEVKPVHEGSALSILPATESTESELSGLKLGKMNDKLDKQFVESSELPTVVYRASVVLTITTMGYKRKEVTKKQNRTGERVARQPCLQRDGPIQKVSDDYKWKPFTNELQKIARMEGLQTVKEIKRHNTLPLTRLCIPICDQRPQNRKCRVEFNICKTKLFPDFQSLPSLTENKPTAQATRIEYVPNDHEILESKTSLTFGQSQNGGIQTFLSESASRSKTTSSDLINATKNVGDLCSSDRGAMKEVRHKSPRKRQVQKHCKRALCDTLSDEAQVFVSVETKVNFQRHGDRSLSKHASANCLEGRGNTRFRAEKWAWMKFAVVVLWVVVTLNTAQALNGCDALGHTVEPQVCIGDQNFRNDPRTLASLCNCTKIIGYLSINLITDEGSNAQVLNSFRFLHLREITKYLLVTRVSRLTSLSHMFPSLAVIGGSTLLYNYALVIYRVQDLEYLGLSNLTILRGAVMIKRNPKLCYVDTVDWGQVTKNPVMENIIKRNKQDCKNCTAKCGKSEVYGEKTRCWGPDHCQNQCQECDANCQGEECCHEECAGGCSSPRNASACVACKHVFYNGSCMKECPVHMYKIFDWTCVSETECLSRKKTSLCDKGCQAVRKCVQQCARSSDECTEECLEKNARRCYRHCPPYGRKCVFHCPTKHGGMGNACLSRRNSSAEEPCFHAKVTTIQSAQELQFCTSIRGLEISINDGDNIEEELAYNLRNIEVIKDYLLIFNTNITSTNILRNLRLIEGQRMIYNNYSLAVLNNLNLNSLDPWLGPNKLLVKNGKALFLKNPRLCLHQVEELVRSANITAIDEKDISATSNNNGISCTKKPLTAHVSPSSEYGTLKVHMETKLPEPFSPTLYRYAINYRIAEQNISLPEPPCLAIEWLVMEGTVEGGNNITAKIRGLAPDTRYAVYVKTYNPQSQAQYSQISYTRTSPFNPTPPVKLSWAPWGRSELRIWWEPPRESNGILDHYIVSATLLRSPPPARKNINFCRIEDKVQQVTEAARNTILKRKDEWKVKTEKEQLERAAEEEKRQNKAASCCDCEDAQKRIAAPQALDENNRDTDFEDYLISDVRCKQTIKIEGKLLYKCGRIPEDEVSGDGVFTQDEKEDRDRRKESGQEEGSRDQLQPLAQQESDADTFDGNTIVGYYQKHNPDANYNIMDTTNSSFVTVHTKNLSVVLTELLPENLYSISVVACLTPTNCTTSPNTKGKHQKVVACKLCSSIPAKTAALIPSTNLGTATPNQSLRAELQNGTNRVKVSWRPPTLFNGHILYYHIELNPQENSRLKCVNERDFERQKREEFLHLPPGNYSISVRARTQAGFGPKSNTDDVYVPETNTKDYSPIIWSVVGAFCILVACLAVGFWRIHKSKYDIPSTLDLVEDNPCYGEELPTRDLFSDGYLLQRNDLRVFKDKPLGQGYFSKVLFGELTQNGTVTRVAVKTPKDPDSPKEIIARAREFLEEAVVMQNIHCHHIVTFLGVVGDYVPVYIVMELMQEGDLKDYLKGKHHPLSIQQTLKFAAEAADGMAYLAFHNLVHRDLAARNCLLTADLTLKISDFGLTRNVKNQTSLCYHKEGTGILPFRSLAPESMRFGSYTTKSDVWSYGVLLWEIATKGATPFKGWEMQDVTWYIVKERRTLPTPKGCKPFLMNLMKECWSYEPTRRPAFVNIVGYLLKHIDGNFLTSFEKVSFFHSRMSEVMSACHGCDLEDDWKPQPTNQERANIRPQNEPPEPQQESTTNRRSADQCVVHAQVECLLPCNDHPHCPTRERFHPLAACQKKQKETSPCLETSTDLDDTVNARTNATNSTETSWCSNHNSVRGVPGTAFCCDGSDHQVYTDMSVGDLPQVPPSLKHSRWQYNSDERACLIPSLPSTPSEDDKKKPWPCKLHTLQSNFKQPSLHSDCLPVCQSQSKYTGFSVPKTNILLQPFPIPSSTALPCQESSSEQVSTSDLTPLNHRAMMSAPPTPSSTPFSINAPHVSSKKRLPQVQSSYALLSLTNRCDTRNSTGNRLGHLDAFNLNASTPSLPLRDQGSSVNNATAAHSRSPAKSLPKTGATPSPTSTVLEFTGNTRIPPPTSASRPLTAHLTLPPKLSAPYINPQETAAFSNPPKRRMPLTESPSRRNSLEFASSVSGQVEAALPVSLPLPTIESPPTSTITPTPPPFQQKQQLLNVPPSASPLPKKIISSVLQSDLPSGQSNSSSARQSSSSVSKENLTELELM